MLVDLHVVVPTGDAGVVDRALEACARAGLDGLCLLGAGVRPPVEAARGSAHAAGLALFFGIEYAVERGRLAWIPEDPAALDGAPAVATAAEVIALAEARGGLVMAAHPYVRWNGPSFSDAIYQMTGLGAVEIANAALDHARNNLALDAAQRLRLAAVGGSGSGAGPADIGAAATVFPEPVADQAGLVAALRRADVIAIELLATPEQVGELEPEEAGSSRGPAGGHRDAGPRAAGPGPRDRGPRPEHADRPADRPAERPAERHADRPERPADRPEEGEGHRRRRRRRGGRGPGQGPAQGGVGEASAGPAEGGGSEGGEGGGGEE